MIFNFLKPLQGKCIKSGLHNDTLVVLPTGYGKCLIYEMLPRIQNTKIVVISPLKAIIEDQYTKLGELAVSIDGKLMALTGVSLIFDRFFSFVHWPEKKRPSFL